MEPVHMMIGHAADDAAHLALAGKTTVQKVDAEKLRELLRKEGAVLDAASAAAPKPEKKIKPNVGKKSVSPLK